MDVKEFILLPHRWQWGYCDCTLFTADWVKEATGKDPGEGLRGTYFDAEDANAIIARAGGIERLVGSRLEGLGFKRISELRDGDVGIVETLTGFAMEGAETKHIPAIKFGPLWAVMSARGPMAKALPWTGAAWRIA